MKLVVSIILCFGLISSAVSQCPQYQFIVFTATSAKELGLNKAIVNYEKALGGKNNHNDKGPLFSGFRRINWDAPAKDAPNLRFVMPGNFFNKNVPRGAVFKAKGDSFAVSNPDDNNPKDFRFDSILPAAIANRFSIESPKRLFTPRKKNKLTVNFQIPGQLGSKATTIGFAAVFTDVVKKRKTKMVYKDSKGCKIATVIVPTQPKGLSFAGIIVQRPGTSQPLRSIAKVNIKLGTVAVDAANKNWSPGFSGDVVVLDDLVYGEPY